MTAETARISRRLIGIVLAGIVALTILTNGAVRLVVRVFARPPALISPPPVAALQTPSPRLATDPMAEWTALHAKEDALLNTYGWADSSSRTVRIPIDRAIDLLSRSGLPHRSATKKASAGTALQ